MQDVDPSPPWGRGPGADRAGGTGRQPGLQRLEADAARATERNRIAREIHDSVGHALSVVTVQASAARKVIGRDPDFAANALATIETASRRAAAELDQMLGLLRDEAPRPAAPAPGLAGSLGTSSPEPGRPG